MLLRVWDTLFTSEKCCYCQICADGIICEGWSSTTFSSSKQPQIPRKVFDKQPEESGSTSEPHSTSATDGVAIEYKIGDYVVACYDRKYFFGNIVDKDGDMK